MLLLLLLYADPDCSLYFFQSLDASTKQCTIVRPSYSL